MQSAYPERFQREMSCQESDWLRWLPAAVGEHSWHISGKNAEVDLHPGTLKLVWSTLEPRRISGVQLPLLSVRFEFDGVTAQQRMTFMRRFDLYLQRGGG